MADKMALHSGSRSVAVGPPPTRPRRLRDLRVWKGWTQRDRADAYET